MVVRHSKQFLITCYFLLLSCLCNLTASDNDPTEHVRRIQLKGQLIALPQRIGKYHILVVSDDRRISLIDVLASIQWTVQLPKRIISPPQVSLEGTILITMLDQNFVLLSMAGSIIRSWSGQSNPIKHMYLSPEGRILKVDHNNRAFFCHPNGETIFELSSKALDWSQPEFYYGGLMIGDKKQNRAVFFWSGRLLDNANALALGDYKQLGQKLGLSKGKETEAAILSGQLHVTIDKSVSYYEARVFSSNLDVLVRAKTSFGYQLLDQNEPALFAWGDGLWHFYIVAEKGKNPDGTSPNLASLSTGLATKTTVIDQSFASQDSLIRRLLSEAGARQAQDLHTLVKQSLEHNLMAGRLYFYEDFVLQLLELAVEKPSQKANISVLIETLSLIPSSRHIARYYDFFEQERDASLELAWIDLFSKVNSAGQERLLDMIVKKIETWQTSNWSNRIKDILQSKAKYLLSEKPTGIQ